MYWAFIDLKRAYDEVNREKLWWVLRMKMGTASSVVPCDLVNNINTEEYFKTTLNTGNESMTNSKEREDNDQGIDPSESKNGTART